MWHAIFLLTRVKFVKFLLKTVIYCDFLLKCNIFYMSADVEGKEKFNLYQKKSSQKRITSADKLQILCFRRGEIIYY